MYVCRKRERLRGDYGHTEKCEHVCCVCVCVERERVTERERETDRQREREREEKERTEQRREQLGVVLEYYM